MLIFFNESVLHIAQNSGDQLGVYQVYALVLALPYCPNHFLFFLL